MEKTKQRKWLTDSQHASFTPADKRRNKINAETPKVQQAKVRRKSDGSYCVRVTTV